MISSVHTTMLKHFYSHTTGMFCCIHTFLTGNWFLAEINTIPFWPKGRFSSFCFDFFARTCFIDEFVSLSFYLVFQFKLKIAIVLNQKTEFQIMRSNSDDHRVSAAAHLNHQCNFTLFFVWDFIFCIFFYDLLVVSQLQLRRHFCIIIVVFFVCCIPIFCFSKGDFKLFQSCFFCFCFL